MAVWITRRGKKYYLYVERQGKRIVRVIGTDKREADKVATSVRSAIVCGTYTPENNTDSPQKQSTLLKDYTDKWYKMHSPLNADGNLIVQIRNDDRLHWRPSTTIRNEEILRLYILPVFGDRLMESISKSEIKDYFVKLTHTTRLQPKTIGSIFSLLGSIYNEAIEDELVSINPVKGLSKYINKRSNRRLDSEYFLTREEVSKILQTAQTYFSHYYPFLLCAFRTGMRLGELIALRWADIDFNGNFIEVKNSFFREFETSTKSKKTRKIDMSQQLHDELILWRVRQKELCESIGEPIPDYVFCTVTGYRIKASHFRDNIWRKCLEKAGIRYIKFHSTRHTFCSLLLQQGESPVYVQQQMGHHSIELTVGVYGHLIPGINRSAVNKLDDAQLLHRDCTNLVLVK
ncbi:MAG: tyrosine-type recombinase/integrase [bacterium]